MIPAPRLLVFSDLDGTLLDHQSYSWLPAARALAQLREAGCGVILASSKTAVEIAPLRDAMGFGEWPAIVENGGGLLEPDEDGAWDDTEYRDLRDTLKRLPVGFTGFGDMTPQDIADHTGLSLEDARNAKARQFSEPGLWTGEDGDLNAFVTAARDAGLAVQRGGRFITLSFGGTKADRMDMLIDRYRPNHTVALGDAPNDIDMLTRADYGFVVINPDSPGIPPLPGEETSRIRRTTRTGPEGWTEAVTALLQELSMTKDPVSHG